MDARADRPPPPPAAANLVSAAAFALVAVLAAAHALATTRSLVFAASRDGFWRDLVLAAVTWLYGAVMAGAAAGLRPRPGRERWASNYLAFLTGQACVVAMLFGGLTEHALTGGGKVLAALPPLPAVAGAALLLGPPVALVALARVRAGGLALAGQLVPFFLVAWVAAIGTGVPE